MDILQGVTVGETMTRDVQTVSIETTLAELTEILTRTHRHGLLVLDSEGKLWGIVTVTDLEQALEEGRPYSATASEIGTTWPRLKVTYPDDTIGDALAIMGTRGLGRLPVVAHDDPYHLLGLVRREDIIRAYNLALTRRAEVQHRTRQIESTNEEGTEFVEVILHQDDKAIGQTVMEIAPQLPTQCVLISIRRDGKTIIPHGDTVFRPGDHITAFVDSKDGDELFHCLHG